jgi:hypothetical protein
VKCIYMAGTALHCWLRTCCCFYDSELDAVTGNRGRKSMDGAAGVGSRNRKGCMAGHLSSAFRSSVAGDMTHTDDVRAPSKQGLVLQNASF